MSIKDPIGSAQAAVTPVQQVTMEWAQAHMLRNLFYRFAGSRPDMEERLQKAFLSRFKRPMRDVTKRDVRATYLESEPGHGKTTTHRKTCEEFAKLMGLRFIEDVTLADLMHGKIDRNCFVFSTINLGGATSKMEIGGLMAKLRVLTGEKDSDGKPQYNEFMGHLPDWRMASAMMGAFGYVLFDDFPTSSHQVQNACLDMLLGGSAGDMQFNVNDLAASSLKMEGKEIIGTIDSLQSHKHVRGSSPVHMGLAGNRGVRDGNKIFPLTTAVATRIERLDVQDTLENWTKRAQDRNTDAIGDAYYSDFLREHPEFFSNISKPINGILPQMPTPRSNDALMGAIGDLVHEYGGFADIAASSELSARFVDDVTRLAGAHIGSQIHPIGAESNTRLTPAVTVSGFYQEMLIGAIPVANAIIKKGEVDVELIKAKYDTGSNGPGQNFGYQFMTALARTAASEIATIFNKGGPERVAKELENRDSPTSMEVRQILGRMSSGMSFVQAPMISYALSRFTSALAKQCPAMFQAETNYQVPNQGVIATFMYGFVRDNDRFPNPAINETVASVFTGFSAEIGGLESSFVTNHLRGMKTMGNASRAATL